MAGKDIQPDLAVGPDPGDNTQPTDSDEDPLVTPGMRWMVYYAAAVEAGMAVTITRAMDANMDMPLTRLIAYGVDEAGDPVTGGARLAGLLEAHHYTDGFGFVDPGTATNNTELGRSGLDARAEEVSERYRLTDGSRTAPPAVAGVAGRLASAPGVTGPSTVVLSRDPAGARVDYQADTNALLWPSTWGYFLLHNLEGIGQPAVREARRHFIDHVRALGTLPVLRVGEQPYGFLPVMSLKHWADREGGTATHAAMVRILRQVLPEFVEASWRATVGQRWSGQSRAGMTERYHQLLATGAQPVDYVGRSALGPEYVGNLWRFLRLRHRVAVRAQGPGQPGPQRPRAARGPAAYRHHLRRRGLPGAGPDDRHRRRRLPGAAAGDDTGAARRGRRAGYGDAAALPPGPALGAAGVVERRDRGQGRRPGLAGHELVDVDPYGGPTPTLWRTLADPAPADPSRTIEQYLTEAPATDPNVSDLREFTVRALHARRRDDRGDLPAGRSDGLVRGGLDLAAHRIDAWVGVVRGRRLTHLRDRPAAVALAIGGFGWLSNFVPAKR